MNYVNRVSYMSKPQLRDDRLENESFRVAEDMDYLRKCL